MPRSKGRAVFTICLLLISLSSCSGEVQNEDIAEPRERGAMEPDGREPVMTDD
jgi:hypothetical protein